MHNDAGTCRDFAVWSDVLILRCRLSAPIAALNKNLADYANSHRRVQMVDCTRHVVTSSEVHCFGLKIICITIAYWQTYCCCAYQTRWLFLEQLHAAPTSPMDRTGQPCYTVTMLCACMSILLLLCMHFRFLCCSSTTSAHPKVCKTSLSLCNVEWRCQVQHAASSWFAPLEQCGMGCSADRVPWPCAWPVSDRMILCQKCIEQLWHNSKICIICSTWIL